MALLAKRPITLLYPVHRRLLLLNALGPEGAFRIKTTIFFFIANFVLGMLAKTVNIMN